MLFLVQNRLKDRTVKFCMCVCALHTYMDNCKFVSLYWSKPTLPMSAHARTLHSPDFLIKVLAISDNSDFSIFFLYFFFDVFSAPRFGNIDTFGKTQSGNIDTFGETQSGNIDVFSEAYSTSNSASEADLKLK